MDAFFSGYLLAWIAACIAAAAIAIRKRAGFAAVYAGYVFFLARPWKLATFAIATAGIMLVAPYTGDPTWDWFDALFMSVLTFLTAPWSVGVLHRGLKGRSPPAHVFVAAVAWMFSASWSYDLYLLLRDGTYPFSWSANIAASSVLYLCAGLLWNLEYAPGRGVVFAFMREGWPRAGADTSFRPIAWAAAPFMAIAATAILWFVWEFLAGR